MLRAVDRRFASVDRWAATRSPPDALIRVPIGDTAGDIEFAAGGSLQRAPVRDDVGPCVDHERFGGEEPSITPFDPLIKVSVLFDRVVGIPMTPTRRCVIHVGQRRACALPVIEE